MPAPCQRRRSLLALGLAAQDGSFVAFPDKNIYAIEFKLLA